MVLRDDGGGGSIHGVGSPFPRYTVVVYSLSQTKLTNRLKLIFPFKLTDICKQLYVKIMCISVSTNTT